MARLLLFVRLLLYRCDRAWVSIIRCPIRRSVWSSAFRAHRIVCEKYTQCPAALASVRTLEDTRRRCRHNKLVNWGNVRNIIPSMMLKYLWGSHDNYSRRWTRCAHRLLFAIGLSVGSERSFARWFRRTCPSSPPAKGRGSDLILILLDKFESSPMEKSLSPLLFRNDVYCTYILTLVMAARMLSFLNLAYLLSLPRGDEWYFTRKVLSGSHFKFSYPCLTDNIRLIGRWEFCVYYTYTYIYIYIVLDVNFLKVKRKKR